MSVCNFKLTRPFNRNRTKKLSETQHKKRVVATRAATAATGRMHLVVNVVESDQQNAKDGPRHDHVDPGSVAEKGAVRV